MEEKLAELIRMVVSQESNTDSIEMGSPSKGGVAKVYFNAEKPELAKAKIDSVCELRKYMAEKMGTNGKQEAV